MRGCMGRNRFVAQDTPGLVGLRSGSYKALDQEQPIYRWHVGV